MRAIQYKERDGFKVVVGESRPIRDPMRTLENATNVVLSAPASEDLVSLLRQARKLGRPCPEHVRRKLRVAISEYAAEHPLYFDTVPGQILMTDEAAASLLGSDVPEKAVLLIDGSYAPNHVGEVYFIKERGRWHSMTIEHLGELPLEGSVLESDLSDEQKEEIAAQNFRDRWVGVDEEKIDALQEQALERALDASVALRIRLEVSEDREVALEKAREFFSREKQKISEEFEEIRNVRKTDL